MRISTFLFHTCIKTTRFHFFSLFPFLSPRAAPPQVAASWPHFAPNLDPPFPHRGPGQERPYYALAPALPDALLRFPRLLSPALRNRHFARNAPLFLPLRLFTSPTPLPADQTKRPKVATHRFSRFLYDSQRLRFDASSRSVFVARDPRRVGIART